MEMTEQSQPWWKGAVVYQVYIRSFFDTNGDGQGDLPGVLAKLDYIQSLGIDCIWLSPVHPSPNRDWGYDISDYEGIQHDYGTMADFQAVIDGAHQRGLKVILDEVLCHCSDEHPWFREALDAASAKADWFVWADPKPDGTAPNNWLSVFGGPAWAYRPERRQHYHHKFLRTQPKIDWRNPAAREACMKVMDFWLDKGVDGFRLDVANAYLHDPSLTDNPAVEERFRDERYWSDASQMQRRLYEANNPDNITALDEIRRRVEAHGPDRWVFGEFSEEPQRSGAYAASDEGLHAGYTFNMLLAKTYSPAFVKANYATLAAYPRHWPCASFSNHDVPRTAQRFATTAADRPAIAQLMLALLLSLKGVALMYMGEELGLPDGDLRRDQLRDPVGDLYYPDNKGRDGCRIPIPWTEGANHGFSSGVPWLPAVPEHNGLSVATQSADPASTLNVLRQLTAARKGSGPLKWGDITFLDLRDPILGFTRSHAGETVTCLFNMSDAAVDVPAVGAFILSGGEAGQGTLGPHAWVISR